MHSFIYDQIIFDIVDNNDRTKFWALKQAVFGDNLGGKFGSSNNATASGADDNDDDENRSTIIQSISDAFSYASSKLTETLRTKKKSTRQLNSTSSKNLGEAGVVRKKSQQEERNTSVIVMEDYDNDNSDEHGEQYQFPQTIIKQQQQQQKHQQEKEQTNHQQQVESPTT